MRTEPEPEPEPTPGCDLHRRAGRFACPSRASRSSPGGRVATGCAPGRNGAADPITLAQMANFLLRAFLGEG